MSFSKLTHAPVNAPVAQPVSKKKSILKPLPRVLLQLAA
jgi:hypothetical protein